MRLTTAEIAAGLHAFNRYVIAPDENAQRRARQAERTPYEAVVAKRKDPPPKRDDLPPTTTACVKCGHALSGHHTLISGTGIGQRKCDEPGCRCPNKAPEYGR